MQNNPLFFVSQQVSFGFLAIGYCCSSLAGILTWLKVNDNSDFIFVRFFLDDANSVFLILKSNNRLVQFYLFSLF